MNSELCTLDFKCAKTGKQFQVNFIRSNPADNFIIQSIEPPMQTEASGDNHFMLPAPDTSSQALTLTSGHAEILTSNKPVKPKKKKRGDFSADQFDLTNWGCPHCNYVGGEDLPQFVLCGKCGECVCGKQSTITDKGETRFICHSACGRKATVKGEIESYNGASEKGQLAINSPRQDILPEPQE
jgi:hypothetical protein